MTSSPQIPGPPHPPEPRSQRGENAAPIPQPEASPRASSSPIPQPAAPSTRAPIPSPPASGDSTPEQGQTHGSVRRPQAHDARAGRSFPQTGVPTPVASAPAVAPQASGASGFAPQTSGTSGFAPQTSGTSGFAPQAVGAPQGAPTQFTPAFQRFVDAGPSMPAPGAAQYPQVAPQAVHTWALPTTTKKLPVFEAVVVGAGLALMLVGMYSYLAASGPFIGLFLAIVCLVPLCIIILFLQFVDRFEPEPWWTKIAAFLWGGGVAIFFAGLSNALGGAFVAGATGDASIGEASAAVVFAPIGEELLKALAVVVIVFARRNQISSPLDGLVYAGFSAAGFLVVEDFEYFLKALADGVFAHIFFIRVFMGVFGHVMYTTCTGWAIGWAVTRARSAAAGIGAVFFGYFIAVSLHGLWNSMGYIAGSTEGYYILYAVLQVPIFVCWLIFVGLAIRRERRDTAAGLIPYVHQGWVLASEVQMVCDPAMRRNALTWISGGGPAAKRSLKNFMYALASLGLDQVVMNVRGPEPGRIQSTRETLQQAAEERRRFLGLMGMG